MNIKSQINIWINYFLPNNILNLSGLAFFKSIARPPKGGSEAQMPKIKVIINQLE